MRNIKPKTDKYMKGGMGPMLKEEKSKPIYPTFRVDLEHLPEAKKWDLGKQYGLEMQVKLIGLSQSRFDNSAEFEIRKIGSSDVGETEQEEGAEGEDDSAEDHE